MRYDRISRSSEPVSYDPASLPADPAVRDHLGGVSADGRITSFATESEQRVSGDDNGVADIVVTESSKSAGDEDTADLDNGVVTGPSQPAGNENVADLGVEFGQYELSPNGEGLQLTIKVINWGDKTLERIRLSGKTPPRLKLVSAVSDSGACDVKKHLKCRFDALAPGSEIHVELSMQVKKRTGTIALRAKAASATKETKNYRKNNRATLKFTLPG